MDKSVEKRYLQIKERKDALKKRIEEKYERHIKPLEEEIEILSQEEDEITLNEIKKVTEVKKIDLLELTERLYKKENINE